MKYGLPRFARNDDNGGEPMKYGLPRFARNDDVGRVCMIFRNLLTNIPLVCILILDTVGMYVTK